MELANDLLLRVARGEKVERPPVWLMRQAGRILPQYREIRARLSGFKELVETPALAAEVTIQPVDELGVDAAILFSDILVIPEAMGLPYEMVEKSGPAFPKTIRSERDITDLVTGTAAAERLEYVYQALDLTRKGLDGRVPLIGFSGAPWTLMAYMLEGKGSKTFSVAKRFLYRHPDLAHRLLEKISETIIAYLKLKIASGADLVQLFDSWAGILSPAQYHEFAGRYTQAICAAITEVPITVFAKGAWFALPEIAAMDCQVIGVDWNTDPEKARQWIGPGKALQGNLDPCCLYADAAEIRVRTIEMISRFAGNHVVNLGHGVYPDTPLENVRTFVQTVKKISYSAPKG